LQDLLRLLDPDTVSARLDALARLTGVGLRLRRETDRAPDETPAAVTLGGRPSGYVVCADRAPQAEALASFAADDLARLARAEADLASMAQEIADRYEELNFLYDMSASVGSIDDVEAVCRHIVQQTAAVLEARRCSIMLLDEASRSLGIVAAVGLPEGVAETACVPLGQGVAGRVADQARPVIASSSEDLPPDALRSDDLADSHPFVSCPLLVPDEDPRRPPRILGVLNLTRRADGAPFNSSDLKLVNAIAAYAATHVRNCLLLEAQRRRLALEQEMELAARIQTGLLPARSRGFAGLAVGADCRLAQNVGGDYFDYWMIRPGTLGLVIADVSGHNIGAALLAASLRSTLRAQAALALGVAETVRSVNKLMFDDLAGLDMFLSLVYLECDLASARIRYCRAGHPKPLLLRDGEPLWLDTDGALVGILPDAEYEEREEVLRPADLLVFYTDGVTDAGPDETDLFGTGGVFEAACRAATLEPRRIAESVVREAAGHLAGAAQADDMAVVALRKEP
jgi:sigma-B regulation protein RsbU (phosphoserine phosphatase)